MPSLALRHVVEHVLVDRHMDWVRFRHRDGELLLDVDWIGLLHHEWYLGKHNGPTLQRFSTRATMESIQPRIIMGIGKYFIAVAKLGMKITMRLVSILNLFAARSELCTFT